MGRGTEFAQNLTVSPGVENATVADESNVPAMVEMKSRMTRVFALLGLMLAGITACGPSGAGESVTRRGDVAFAADSLEEALAEYRLAVRQGNNEPELALRVAHTYVELGRVEEASEFYREAVRRDPDSRDQAVSDLTRLARSAAARGDRFQMASAVEEALALEPALGLDGMALPLARHYFLNGEYGRALPLYQRALASGSDTLPQVVFEIGQAHEQIGDCQRALIFFEQFRGGVRRADRGEVDWFIGNCSYRVARALRGDAQRTEQDMERALTAVDRAIEVGEPRNIQGQAWFERGEILAELGDCEGAMDSFAQVRFSEPGGAGPLVSRAQERFDRLRFGRGLDRFRSEGGCG